jgi:hypothetical protein
MWLTTILGSPCLSEIPEEDISPDLIRKCAKILTSKFGAAGHFYVSASGLYTAYPPQEFDQRNLVQILKDDTDPRGYCVMIDDQ